MVLRHSFRNNAAGRRKLIAVNFHMNPFGSVALNQTAGSEFKRYASIVRDRDFQKFRVNAIDFCKMLFCLFLESAQKVAVNLVAYLEIQINGHSVEVIADAKC